MTMTMPPKLPGSQRIVPANLTSAQRERLKWLLEQTQYWTLRPHWRAYLDKGGEDWLVPLTTLSRDQRLAAAAWIHQQRHPLHRALHDGKNAGEDWLEELPLYRALYA